MPDKRARQTYIRGEEASTSVSAGGIIKHYTASWALNTRLGKPLRGYVCQTQFFLIQLKGQWRKLEFICCNDHFIVNHICMRKKQYTYTIGKHWKNTELNLPKLRRSQYPFFSKALFLEHRFSDRVSRQILDFGRHNFLIKQSIRQSLSDRVHQASLIGRVYYTQFTCQAGQGNRPYCTVDTWGQNLSWPQPP